MSYLTMVVNNEKQKAFQKLIVNRLNSIRVTRRNFGLPQITIMLNIINHKIRTIKSMGYLKIKGFRPIYQPQEVTQLPQKAQRYEKAQYHPQQAQNIPSLQILFKMLHHFIKLRKTDAFISLRLNNRQRYKSELAQQDYYDDISDAQSTLGTLNPHERLPKRPSSVKSQQTVPRTAGLNQTVSSSRSIKTDIQPSTEQDLYSTPYFNRLKQSSYGSSSQEVEELRNFEVKDRQRIVKKERSEQNQGKRQKESIVTLGDQEDIEQNQSDMRKQTYSQHTRQRSISPSASHKSSANTSRTQSKPPQPPISAEYYDMNKTSRTAYSQQYSDAEQLEEFQEIQSHSMRMPTRPTSTTQSSRIIRQKNQMPDQEKYIDPDDSPYSGYDTSRSYKPDLSYSKSSIKDDVRLLKNISRGKYRAEEQDYQEEQRVRQAKRNKYTSQTPQPGQYNQQTDSIRDGSRQQEQGNRNRNNKALRDQGPKIEADSSKISYKSASRQRNAHQAQSQFDDRSSRRELSNSPEYNSDLSYSDPEEQIQVKRGALNGRLKEKAEYEDSYISSDSKFAQQRRANTSIKQQNFSQSGVEEIGQDSSNSISRIKSQNSSQSHMKKQSQGVINTNQRILRDVEQIGSEQKYSNSSKIKRGDNAQANYAYQDDDASSQNLTEMSKRSQIKEYQQDLSQISQISKSKRRQQLDDQQLNKQQLQNSEIQNRAKVQGTRSNLSQEDNHAIVQLPNNQKSNVRAHSIYHEEVPTQAISNKYIRNEQAYIQNQSDKRQDRAQYSDNIQSQDNKEIRSSKQKEIFEDSRQKRQGTSPNSENTNIRGNQAKIRQIQSKGSVRKPHQGQFISESESDISEEYNQKAVQQRLIQQSGKKQTISQQRNYEQFSQDQSEESYDSQDEIPVRKTSNSSHHIRKLSQNSVKQTNKTPEIQQEFGDDISKQRIGQKYIQHTGSEKIIRRSPNKQSSQISYNSEKYSQNSVRQYKANPQNQSDIEDEMYYDSKNQSLSVRQDAEKVVRQSRIKQPLHSSYSTLKQKNLVEIQYDSQQSSSEPEEQIIQDSKGQRQMAKQDGHRVMHKTYKQKSQYRQEQSEESDNGEKMLMGQDVPENMTRREKRKQQEQRGYSQNQDIYEQNRFNQAQLSGSSYEKLAQNHQPEALQQIQDKQSQNYTQFTRSEQVRKGQNKQNEGQQPNEYFSDQSEEAQYESDEEYEISMPRKLQKGISQSKQRKPVAQIHQQKQIKRPYTQDIDESESSQYEEENLIPVTIPKENPQRKLNKGPSRQQKNPQLQYNSYQDDESSDNQQDKYHNHEIIQNQRGRIQKVAKAEHSVPVKNMRQNEMQTRQYQDYDREYSSVSSDEQQVIDQQAQIKPQMKQTVQEKRIQRPPVLTESFSHSETEEDYLSQNEDANQYNEQINSEIRPKLQKQQRQPQAIPGQNKNSRQLQYTPEYSNSEEEQLSDDSLQLGSPQKAQRQQRNPPKHIQQDLRDNRNIETFKQKPSLVKREDSQSISDSNSDQPILDNPKISNLPKQQRKQTRNQSSSEANNKQEKSQVISKRQQISNPGSDDQDYEEITEKTVQRYKNRDKQIRLYKNINQEREFNEQHHEVNLPKNKSPIQRHSKKDIEYDESQQYDNPPGRQVKRGKSSPIQTEEERQSIIQHFYESSDEDEFIPQIQNKAVQQEKSRKGKDEIQNESKNKPIISKNEQVIGYKSKIQSEIHPNNSNYDSGSDDYDRHDISENKIQNPQIHKNKPNFKNKQQADLDYDFPVQQHNPTIKTSSIDPQQYQQAEKSINQNPVQKRLKELQEQISQMSSPKYTPVSSESQKRTFERPQSRAGRAKHLLERLKQQNSITSDISSPQSDIQYKPDFNPQQKAERDLQNLQKQQAIDKFKNAEIDQLASDQKVLQQGRAMSYKHLPIADITLDSDDSRNSSLTNRSMLTQKILDNKKRLVNEARAPEQVKSYRDYRTPDRLRKQRQGDTQEIINQPAQNIKQFPDKSQQSIQPSIQIQSDNSPQITQLQNYDSISDQSKIFSIPAQANQSQTTAFQKQGGRKFRDAKRFLQKASENPYQEYESSEQVQENLQSLNRYPPSPHPLSSQQPQQPSNYSNSQTKGHETAKQNLPNIQIPRRRQQTLPPQIGISPSAYENIQNISLPLNTSDNLIDSYKQKQPKPNSKHQKRQIQKQQKKVEYGFNMQGSDEESIEYQSETPRPSDISEQMQLMEQFESSDDADFECSSNTSSGQEQQPRARRDHYDSSSHTLLYASPLLGNTDYLTQKSQDPIASDISKVSQKSAQKVSRLKLEQLPGESSNEEISDLSEGSPERPTQIMQKRITSADQYSVDIDTPNKSARRYSNPSVDELEHLSPNFTQSSEHSKKSFEFGRTSPKGKPMLSPTYKRKILPTLNTAKRRNAQSARQSRKQQIKPAPKSQMDPNSPRMVSQIFRSQAEVFESIAFQAHARMIRFYEAINSQLRKRKLNFIKALRRINTRYIKKTTNYQNLAKLLRSSLKQATYRLKLKSWSRLKHNATYQSQNMNLMRNLIKNVQKDISYRLQVCFDQWHYNKKMDEFDQLRSLTIVQIFEDLIGKRQKYCINMFKIAQKRSNNIIDIRKSGVFKIVKSISKNTRNAKQQGLLLWKYFTQIQSARNMYRHHGLKSLSKFVQKKIISLKSSGFDNIRSLTILQTRAINQLLAIITEARRDLKQEAFSTILYTNSQINFQFTSNYIKYNKNNSNKLLITYLSLFCLMMLLPIILQLITFMIRDHSGSSGIPAGWAYFSISICMLKTLHKSQNLMHITANWQIVNTHMPQNS